MLHSWIDWQVAAHEPRRAQQARGRDIVILTASTGCGHDSVAAALQHVLNEGAPDISVWVMDPLSVTDFARLLSAGRWYDAMAAHAPWLWGLCYHATNNEWACRIGMAAGARLWARRLRTTIETEQPSIVVSVHPLCTRLAADVLCSLPEPPSLHCVVTDLVTVHRCWASTAVDAYYVATADAHDTLVRMGIPSHHVQVTGLPLREAFTQAPEAPAADECPRVFLFGGGRAGRWVHKVACALVDAGVPLQLVVVCGRNDRLRRRLQRAVGTRATVLGWHDDIAAMMRWSSLVITKAGPTAVAEALSQARPVVITHTLPGQEAGNVTLVARLRAGCRPPSIAAVVRLVAAGPRAWPTGALEHAAWWGGASGRVARCLLAAHGDLSVAVPVRVQARDHGSVALAPKEAKTPHHHAPDAVMAPCGASGLSDPRHLRSTTMPDDGDPRPTASGTWLPGDGGDRRMRRDRDATQVSKAWFFAARARAGARSLDLDQLPPGKLIINPISGEHVVVRASGAQTEGQVFSFDLFLPPGAHVPARHAHPIQEEQFTVIAGQMRFRIGRFRRGILARPGDTVCIPPGTAHWFGNAGSGVAHARVEARPALRTEEMFEAATSMGVARYIPGKQTPPLADLAVFLREFRREVAVPDVPASLVNALLAPVAWLGGRHGRRGGSGTPR